MCGRHSTKSPRTVIETHLLDVERDLYGRTLRLGFVQRLRDERRVRERGPAEGAGRPPTSRRRGPFSSRCRCDRRSDAALDVPFPGQPACAPGVARAARSAHQAGAGLRRLPGGASRTRSPPRSRRRPVTAWHRPGKGHVTVTFERDANRFRVSLSAPHLSGAPPAKGLMDAVTVDRGASGPTYRYERRIPEAL